MSRPQYVHVQRPHHVLRCVLFHRTPGFSWHDDAGLHRAGEQEQAESTLWTHASGVRCRFLNNAMVCCVVCDALQQRIVERRNEGVHTLAARGSTKAVTLACGHVFALLTLVTLCAYRNKAIALSCRGARGTGLCCWLQFQAGCSRRTQHASWVVCSAVHSLLTV
jgi:hypothetical protein